MTISLSEFLAQLAANPVLAVTVALTLGVVLVNGWTDAPNAIATCVSTRAMSARSAIFMAAVFNFLGVLVMTMVNASVAATIYNMVDFGGNTADALIGAVRGARRHRRMGHGRLVVRHPHQREPRPDRRAVRCGHRAARRLCAASTAASGSRWCTAWFCPLCWASHSAGPRSKAGGAPVQKHGPAAHDGLFRRRTDRGRRGYGVHARRTGRPEVYGRFHAGHLSGQQDRTTSTRFPDPDLADGLVQCRTWLSALPSAATASSRLWAWIW